MGKVRQGLCRNGSLRSWPGASRVHVARGLHWWAIEQTRKAPFFRQRGGRYLLRAMLVHLRPPQPAAAGRLLGRIAARLNIERKGGTRVGEVGWNFLYDALAR